MNWAKAQDLSNGSETGLTFVGLLELGLGGEVGHGEEEDVSVKRLRRVDCKIQINWSRKLSVMGIRGYMVWCREM